MIQSKGIQYILIAGIFFSIVHASVKYCADLHVTQVVFFRALISLIICWYFIKKNNLRIFGKQKRLLFTRGAAGTIALAMYFYTLQKMPLATAVTIQYLSPIFTLILTSILFKEKVPWQQWPFVLLAFIGVIIVKDVNPNISTELALIGLIAAFFAGLAYACVRMLTSKVEPLIVVFYFPMVALPVVTPFMIPRWINPSWDEWIALTLIGVFTYIAQIYMTKAYQEEKAAKVGPYKYFGLIYSGVIGYFVFGEALSWGSLLGLTIIITGVYFSTVTHNRYSVS